MIRAGGTFTSSFGFSPFIGSRRNERLLIKPSSAKKDNVGGDRSQAGESTFSLRLSKAIVARSAIAVFALGFLDAGYSGDWSRIGAISKDTEELLKTAAYFVTPLCLLLIAFVSNSEEDL